MNPMQAALAQYAAQAMPTWIMPAPEELFPKKRFDQMGKVAHDWRYKTPEQKLRLDSMTPRSLEILASISPALAFKLQAGYDLRSHADASESLWFARQLEYIRPGLLEFQFPDLEGKKFVPVENGIPAGAENYTVRGYKSVGEVTVIKDYSLDPPRADVTGIEATAIQRSLGTMYGYNMQELRAAMLAGMPLDVRKAMSARDLMERKHDAIIFYGDTSGNLTGLANIAAGTTSFTVPNGIKGTKLWRDKTPDEIALDMASIVSNVVTQTRGVERPDTLLLPLAAYNMASQRRMGDGSNQTILSFVLSTTPYLKAIEPTWRLNSSESTFWGGSTGRMIAYRRDPMKVFAMIPMDFSQLAPEQRGFEIRTLCEARAGGVGSPYPASISYGDGITDNSDTF